MSVAKLKDIMKEKEMILGERVVLKQIRLGKISEVFIAKNCKVDLRETLDHYSKEFGIKVVELEVDAEEVGSICKKQFAIAILAY
jgi:ribosomal protein L30E